MAALFEPIRSGAWVASQVWRLYVSLVPRHAFCHHESTLSSTITGQGRSQRPGTSPDGRQDPIRWEAEAGHTRGSFVLALHGPRLQVLNARCIHTQTLSLKFSVLAHRQLKRHLAGPFALIIVPSIACAGASSITRCSGSFWHVQCSWAMRACSQASRGRCRSWAERPRRQVRFRERRKGAQASKFLFFSRGDLQSRVRK